MELFIEVCSSFEYLRTSVSRSTISIELEIDEENIRLIGLNKK